MSCPFAEQRVWPPSSRQVSVTILSFSGSRVVVIDSHGPAHSAFLLIYSIPLTHTPHTTCTPVYGVAVVVCVCCGVLCRCGCVPNTHTHHSSLCSMSMFKHDALAIESQVNRRPARGKARSFDQCQHGPVKRRRTHSTHSRRRQVDPSVLGTKSHTLLVCLARRA